MQTLYCYVDGSDNQTIEPLLVEAFGALVAEWTPYCAVLVNLQHERTPDLAPDGLSDWFIGLNIPVRHVGRSQVNQLLLFARDLATVTNRDFVVGITLACGMSEDLVFLDASASEADDVFIHERLEALLHGA